LTPYVTTPTFSINGGNYTNDQTVTISCTTDGATIYYTTDGNTPSAASTLYTTPVLLSGSGYKTLKAIAKKDGMLISGVKTESYYIQPLSISYAGSPYTFTNGVVITDKMPTSSKTVTSYSITPALPNGLTFNTTTGAIGGIPNITSEENITTAYTITATKTGEVVSTTFDITIRIVSICYTWGCFTDQLNGTVKFVGSGIGGGVNYTGTNLTWMKCSQGQTWNATTNGCDGSPGNIYRYCPTDDNACDNGSILTSGPAYTTCNDLVFAGQTDWKVPTISELQTLIHCTNKTMPNTYSDCGNNNYIAPSINKLFPNTVAHVYWSSSHSVGIPNYARFVYFHNGLISQGAKTYINYVRCVRTAP